MAFLKIEAFETIQEKDFLLIYEPEQITPLFRAWLIDPPIEAQNDFDFRAFEYVFRDPKYYTTINEQVGCLFKLSILRHEQWEQLGLVGEKNIVQEFTHKFAFTDGKHQYLSYENALNAIGNMLNGSWEPPAGWEFPALCFYALGETIETWTLTIPEKFCTVVETSKDTLVIECHHWFLSEVVRTLFRVSEQFFSKEELRRIKNGEVFPLHHSTTQKCLKELREKLSEKPDEIVSAVQSYAKSMAFSMVKKMITSGVGISL